MSTAAPWTSDPVVDSAEPWKADPVAGDADKPWTADPVAEQLPDTSFRGALRQGFDQPLEAIGTTMNVLGIPGGKALQGAVDAPANYESASERFVKPQEGDTTVFGFAPAQMPRAIVEQAGQLGGSILSRVAGTLAGRGIGAATGGPAGAIAGGVIGSFSGPFLFGAMQIAGPTAMERAKRNGRTEPNGEDISAALATAAASGSLDAVGAQFLPGGKGAVGSFVAKFGKALFGEQVTESAQSIVEQIGESAGTDMGLAVSVKQAIGEGILGAGAAGAATVASAPFAEKPATKPAPTPAAPMMAQAQQAATASAEAIESIAADLAGKTSAPPITPEMRGVRITPAPEPQPPTTDAIQEPTAGEVGVRNPPEVREGVGGENRPEITPAQGEAPIPKGEEVTIEQAKTEGVQPLPPPAGDVQLPEAQVEPSPTPTPTEPPSRPLPAAAVSGEAPAARGAESGNSFAKRDAEIEASGRRATPDEKAKTQAEKEAFVDGLKEGDEIHVTTVEPQADGSMKPITRRWRVGVDGGRRVADPLDAGGDSQGLEPDSGQHFFNKLRTSIQGGKRITPSVEIVKAGTGKPASAAVSEPAPSTGKPVERMTPEKGDEAFVKSGDARISRRIDNIFTAQGKTMVLLDGLREPIPLSEIRIDPKSDFRIRRERNAAKIKAMEDAIEAQKAATREPSAELTPEQMREGFNPEWSESDMARWNWNRKEQHTKAIESAVTDSKPVSTAAVEAYGIKLPEGWTQRGNLWHPPEAKPAAQAPAPGAKGAVATKKSELLDELRARETQEHPLGRVPKATEKTYTSLAESFDKGSASAASALEKQTLKRIPANVADPLERTRIARRWAADKLISFAIKDVRNARAALPDPRMRGGRIASASDYRNVMYHEGRLAELRRLDAEERATQLTPAPSPAQAPAPGAETKGDLRGFVDSRGVTYDRTNGVWVDTSSKMPGRMTDPKAIARLNEEAAQQAAPAAQAAAPQAAKEPWQMTRAEYADANPLSSSMESDEAFIAYLMKHGRKEQSGLTTVTWNQMVKAKEKTGAYGIEKMDNAAGVITPIINGKQYAVQKRQGYQDSFRKAQVVAALREGRPVPAEVLADYPDLAPTPAPSPAPEAAKAAAPVKPTATLNDARQVKVTTPKGATALRVTDSKGRVIVETLANVNKGANPFTGAGPFKKIEAGTIGKGKEFVSLKGDVSVADVSPATLEAAQKSIPANLRTDPELARTLSGQVEAEETKLRPPGKPEGGALFGAGGVRATTAAVGATPLGSKTWIRLPTLAKRIVGGLEREGAADVMARQQNPTAKLLGRMIRRHVDVEQEIYGQNINILNRAMDGMSKKRSLAAFAELEAYLRAKENGRPLPTLSADAGKIFTAWQDIAESTGNLARAHNVQVFDPKTQSHRPMGNLGRNYVPRMFSRDVQRVLSDPQRDPHLFNALAADIAAHRGITMDEAAAELRGVASRFQGSDFMANIEMARSEQLPESFYDYDLRNLAGHYLPGFSERMGQIIAYGQRLGTRDAPSSPNLWDVARKESEDAHTQEWLRHAEDQATNLRQRNSFMTGAIRAQTLANAMLLSDPTGTVIRNVTSGAAATVEIFGARRSLAKVIESARTGSRMDAKEIGAVRDNIADFLHADQLGHTFADDVIRVVTDKALTWSGYQGSEVFVRTHNGLVASQFAKDAAAAISAAGSKPSRLAAEALAMFKRWDIDPEKIVAEGGDWKAGAESRKFIRTAIREMQGGYRFDQVPLWANSTVGRFFYQYGRWGVQRARNLVQNVIKPLIGEEIDWHGKKMTVRNPRPLLRAAVTIVGLGEVFALIAAGLFDRDRKDASLAEITSALADDVKVGTALALERALNDVIMAGSLGIWGQPIDFVKNIKDQSRFKSPAEPPSLAGAKAVIELAQSAVEQGGKLTEADLMSFAGQVARGPKNLASVARNIFDEPLYEAQNDLSTLRAAARRWSREIGLDVNKARGRPDFGKSPNAPFYEPIQEALLIGDSVTAKRLAREFTAAQPDSEKAESALRSSVQSRQPFRAGPYYSEKHRANFMAWAKNHLSKDDFNQAARIQERYVRAAKSAGLW